MAKYYATPTDLGTALIANAVLLGKRINVVDFALGDGGGSFYLPTKSMTELRNEVWRTGVSHGEINPTSANRIDFYAVVPPDVGGFTIREMGLFDEDNNLVAICNTPDIEKVTFDEGVSYDSLLSISLAVLAPEVLEYKVDPHIIIATKKDIENHNLSSSAHPDIRQQLTAHLQDKANPHGVTAAQAGAYSKDEADALLLNKANIDVPQDYPLPISSNFVASASCRYFKTEDGLVTIYGTVDKSTGTLAHQDVFSTLPVGFRIKSTVELPATIHSPFAVATMLCRTTGQLEIRLDASSRTQNRIYFHCTYLTAK